jgi:DNA-binding transcriptional LysR family regulator
MPLNSEQLEAFWIAAQLRSIQAASRALFVTASAVSQRILALEKRLGQRLFVRAPAGLVLTDVGTRLVDACRQQRQIESSFLARVSGRDGLVGRLSVAAGPYESRILLGPAMGAMGAAHPDLSLQLLPLGAGALSMLETRQADAVVCASLARRKGVTRSHAGRLELALAVSKNTEERLGAEPSGARLKQLTVCDLSLGHVETSQLLARSWPKAEVGSARRAFAEDPEVLAAWLRSGPGIAALPVQLISAYGLKTIRPEITRRVDLYAHSFAEMSTPAIKVLIENLRKSP